jgi:hypothetical protein
MRRFTSLCFFAVQASLQFKAFHPHGPHERTGEGCVRGRQTGDEYVDWCVFPQYFNSRSGWRAAVMSCPPLRWKLRCGIPARRTVSGVQGWELPSIAGCIFFCHFLLLISKRIGECGCEENSVAIHEDEGFIKLVESLIDPAEVCDLYFFQRFKALLPRPLFKKMLAKTSRKTPYMGFVIEPYALFMFFRLKDIEKAAAFLPDRYELMKSAIFAGEDPDYYLGMGIFNTKASTFWGTRLEAYLIAKDKETGLVSWIFIDIISDTLIALPAEGVADRNTKRAIYTTSSKGDVFLEIKEDRSGRRLHVKGNIARGVRRGLDQPLWVLGNTSIAHSRELAGNNEDPFAVIFDPAEVEAALDIPLNDIQLRENSLFPGLAEPVPCKVLCFPFAQHYIADSPGCRTSIKNERDMVENYNRLAGLKEVKTFSTRGIKRMFVSSIIVSFLIFAALFVWLLLK